MVANIAVWIVVLLCSGEDVHKLGEVLQLGLPGGLVSLVGEIVEELGFLQRLMKYCSKIIVFLKLLFRVVPGREEQLCSRCWRPPILTQRDCGQNPRLFLKEEKGFGKVHKGREAEGNRSLHQVLQASHQGH